MSDTPRTTALEKPASRFLSCDYVVASGAAKELERETNRLKGEVESLKAWQQLAINKLLEAGAIHAVLFKANDALRTALSEIHTTAHCIAKAGPLHTPTLEIAWEKFGRIGVMATAALAVKQ